MSARPPHEQRPWLKAQGFVIFTLVFDPAAVTMVVFSQRTDISNYQKSGYVSFYARTDGECRVGESKLRRAIRLFTSGIQRGASGFPEPHFSASISSWRLTSGRSPHGANGLRSFAADDKRG
jgi:hypothetical protein